MKNLLVLVLALFFLFGCSYFSEEPPLGDADQNQLDQNNLVVDQNDTDLNETDMLQIQIDNCKLKESITQRDDCLSALALLQRKSAICQQLEKFSVDFCIKEVGVLSKSEDECKKIQTSFLKNECFYDVAIAKLEKYICEKITGDDPLKIQCRNEIFLLREDTSCKDYETQKQRDDCYKNTALTENNPLICKLVSTRIENNEFVRDKCLNEVLVSFNVPAACEVFLDTSLRDNCFFETGRFLLDDSLCNKSGMQEKIDDCYDFIGKGKPDHTICQKISDKTKRNACINFLAEFNAVPEVCALSTTYYYKDKCNYNIAIDLNQSNYCDTISTGQLKKDCYLQVAIAIANPDLCLNVTPDTEKKDLCYKGVALKLLDESVCEKVIRPADYIYCFSGIANTTNDIAVCDKMKRTTLLNLGYDPKFACYRDYAIEKNLQEVCNLITPTVPKQECIDGTA